MSGYDIYGEMKYEGGIHRVQRIPETDSSDRMHTSTVIVTVFPQPEEVINIAAWISYCLFYKWSTIHVL